MKGAWVNWQHLERLPWNTRSTGWSMGENRGCGEVWKIYEGISSKDSQRIFAEKLIYFTSLPYFCCWCLIVRHCRVMEAHLVVPSCWFKKQGISGLCFSWEFSPWPDADHVSVSHGHLSMPVHPWLTGWSLSLCCLFDPPFLLKALGLLDFMYP